MDLINFCVEYINHDDVITFCLYLMKKFGGFSLRFIKIRSCAILKWFHWSDRFSVNFLVFYCLIRKYGKFSLFMVSEE